MRWGSASVNTANQTISLPNMPGTIGVCAGLKMTITLSLSAWVIALLLGAIAAGIAHGLREQTTRRVGWSRIGIGTLLAGAGAPVAVAALVLFVDLGSTATTVRPVAQALAAIVIGAAWPKVSGVLLTGFSDLIAKFTGGKK